jgi:hypothetical protein
VLGKGAQPKRQTVALFLIRCTRTGRYISTGVEADPDSFDADADIRHRVECPLCGKEHVWRKRDAIPTDPGKWSDVPEVMECFRRAQESADRAAAARNAREREFYSRMERKWLGIAEGYGWMADLEKRFASS